ncbi:MAG: 16S rRNA (guanine(966)-N(2))-methyltransferase RsmD [Candidatus Omnitrophica bacterium]|nr:16S rRNA (guanine(966)-N(2))-methyltransferase RsmD [Candidatus Omnitrophota bacterium]
MRILTGKYKGQTIKTSRGIRPTQGKVRKAIFDILGKIEGLSFLELFAGSGAVGIEALSQGAREVVFVEKEQRCIDTIKKNLSLLDCLDYKVVRSDVFKAIETLARYKKKFNIIFVDPPYYKDISKKTLQILSGCDIVTQNGLIIIQHYKKDNLPDALGDLVLYKQARYADTVLSFYKKVNSDY